MALAYGGCGLAWCVFSAGRGSVFCGVNHCFFCGAGECVASSTRVRNNSSAEYLVAIVRSLERVAIHAQVLHDFVGLGRRGDGDSYQSRCLALWW